MQETEEFLCKTKISKSGRNLFARIPDRYSNLLSRGDLVKIVPLERSGLKDENKLKVELKELLGQPNGEKLIGTILGYKIEVPIAKLINNFPKNKIEKLFLDALLGK